MGGNIIMHKKIIALASALSLGVCCLTGCSSQQEKKELDKSKECMRNVPRDYNLWTG